jgi:hypothetical protein
MRACGYQVFDVPLHGNMSQTDGFETSLRFPGLSFHVSGLYFHALHFRKRHLFRSINVLADTIYQSIMETILGAMNL